MDSSVWHGSLNQTEAKKVNSEQFAREHDLPTYGISESAGHTVAFIYTTSFRREWRKLDRTVQDDVRVAIRAQAERGIVGTFSSQQHKHPRSRRGGCRLEDWISKAKLHICFVWCTSNDGAKRKFLRVGHHKRFWLGEW